MTALSPYIHATGQAAEQIAFYEHVFGATSKVMTYGEMGDQSEMKDKIMHGQVYLKTGEIIMIADSHPDAPEAITGQYPAIGFSGTGEADLESITGYWERITEGGEIIMPFAKQMWGDMYGQVVDKFGVRWHFNVDAKGEGWQ